MRKERIVCTIKKRQPEIGDSFSINWNNGKFINLFFGSDVLIGKAAADTAQNLCDSITASMSGIQYPLMEISCKKNKVIIDMVYGLPE